MKVYIPYLVRKKISFKNLKKKISDEFSKIESDGSMTLGEVKKIDLVTKKSDSVFIDKKSKEILSAYIHFQPCLSESAQKRIELIKRINGFKLTYDTKQNLYWVILESHQADMNLNSNSNIPICCQCGQTIKKNKCDMVEMFDKLTTCDTNEEPNKKRKRMD